MRPDLTVCVEQRCTAILQHHTLEAAEVGVEDLPLWAGQNHPRRYYDDREGECRGHHFVGERR
jgi:hypothetical protein